MVRGANPMAPSSATMSLKKGSSKATICKHTMQSLKLAAFPSAPPFTCNKLSNYSFGNQCIFDSQEERDKNAPLKMCSTQNSKISATSRSAFRSCLTATKEHVGQHRDDDDEDGAPDQPKRAPTEEAQQRDLQSARDGPITCE